MDLTQNLILIKGVNKTASIESIWLKEDKYYVSFLGGDKTYTYNITSVKWLRGPLVLDTNNIEVLVHGRKVRFVRSVSVFVSRGEKFYTVEQENGYTKQYFSHEIEIRTSCLSGKSLNLFQYFKQCAGINKIGIEESVFSDNKSILENIYSKIEFIDDSTAAATYLNPSKGIISHENKSPIFPFGCNASQNIAVRTALSKQISVIQGPPGTGKTQTILNIIANLIIANKSILIVSNNNSATENIYEKLSRNGFGFMVAPLGKLENKERFIENQPELNPKLLSWAKTELETNNLLSQIEETLKELEHIFDMQSRLAVLRQEIAEAEVEMRHFMEEHEFKTADSSNTKVSPEKILRILESLKNLRIFLEDNNFGMLNKIKNTFRRYLTQIRLRLSLGINCVLSSDSIASLFPLVEFQFYICRINELKKEIIEIENAMSEVNATWLTKSMVEKSLTVFKARLSKKFSSKRTVIKCLYDLYSNGNSVLKDYPIVLSTTFSSRLCFSSETQFDYVIMDEASQVSVDTGFLSLTCAKNAVIVGDTMQLPNVIGEEDSVKLNEIKKSFAIPDSYDVSKNSFLNSVLASIPNVPETLLKEHYRCHPDIINFCNQKFYGGELQIMTHRQEGDIPLIAVTTSPGHHSRGHYNQREIDVIVNELLPELSNDSDIGIITPYNDQVRSLRSRIPGIEAATVHKYQGREKDTIIMSVTDDIITEFADNANLLNVAVSRAKNRFCLVVSGNKQELKGNIHDLMAYIRYQRGTFIESKLRSVYDYLHSGISNQLSSGGLPFEYESENLTFELINRIIRNDPKLSHLKILSHYPLRSLIKETTELTEREARYALHPSTHIDFLIINRVSKEPQLAIETDGYSYHNDQTEQFKRDRMKDHILEVYELPLLRLSTVGHSEEQRIMDALTDCLKRKSQK